MLARAARAGVAAVVAVGTGPEDSLECIRLARMYPGVFATVGLHPHEAGRFSPELLATIRGLAAEPHVVGIGETGLDFHYDFAPREQQDRSFRAHLALGRELALPVVVHCREADNEVIAALRAEGQGTAGVLHCFAGGRALLDTALELGWYLSFAGMVTFRNFAGHELLRAVPDDRLLVETDSPYLAPVPHRGRTNEPGFVASTVAALAGHRGVDQDHLSALTASNARRLFGIPGTTGLMAAS